MERRLLVDEEEISYEGLFSMKDLYGIIDDYIDFKGYDKIEPLNEEHVYASGKKIHIISLPMKWHTDYVRKVLKLDINMDEVKEVETEIDKVKVRLNQGKVRILFSAFLDTDWEGRWEQRPFYFFLRTLMDKYVYRKHVHSFEAETVGDLQELKKKIGAFLNLYRFRKAA